MTFDEWWKINAEMFKGWPIEGIAHYVWTISAIEENKRQAEFLRNTINDMEDKHDNA